MSKFLQFHAEQENIAMLRFLVSDDLFGKFSDFTPKFARKYGDMKSLICDCAKRFNEDVKNGNFPSENEVF